MILNISLRIGALTGLVLCAPMPASQDTSQLVASRELVATFGQTLQTELKQAMAAGGPPAAILVCKDKAPRIASHLSRQSGAKVRRTSLRYRNPANAPEPWEADVLATVFGEARTAPDTLPEFILPSDDGATRYMKPIPTAPVCLVCHGQSLTEDVVELLDQHYPHDLARGYALNDIRGAFSVTWPAKSGVTHRPDEIHEDSALTDTP